MSKKLAGKNTLINLGPINSIIIRRLLVYSFYGNTFVSKMIRLGKERSQLKVIYYQIGGSTNAKSLAQRTPNIIPKLKRKGVEVYQYNDEGVCCRCEFAMTFMELKEINCLVLPQLTADYPTPL